MRRRGGGLLHDICILDLTNDQGSFCSKLLADLGAHVIRLEDADEESLQRIGTCNPAEQESLRTSLSFIYHNTNKLIFASEPDSRKGKDALHRLIEKADVLIETLPPARLEALGLGNRLLHGMNPHLIHLSITGFGRTGPKRSYLCSDSVASAFGGQMFLPGSRSGPPIKLAGRQSFYAASLFGANAVLLCLRKRKLTGKGCHFDLSIQESVASTLDDVMIRYFHNGEIAGRDKGSQTRRPFAVLPCRDGFIQIPTLQNWETLLQLMDTEGKAGNLLKANWRKEAYRRKHVTQINQVVAEWTKNHGKRELFRLGQAMRFPWAPVSSLQDVLESPQLKARRFFIGTKSRENKSRIIVPGSPYKFSGFALPSLRRARIRCGQTRQALEGLGAGRIRGISKGKEEAHSKHSSKSSDTLRGIRVLDLTRMLSGPYATRILGDFGAEVIKVQSRVTAEGAERNDTPYFGSWNRNKRSVCLNLNHPDARELFLALTAVSDIVVENYSPRVLANWRLTYRQLKRTKPDLIMASISAMGQTGPWKDFVGFAPTFHALSGLMSATSRNLDSPINVGHAYADVIAGLYGALAILASLEHRDRTIYRRVRL
jgi:crotonobetainyl-CoA:carnitine CoA-transferase CaiB-like acyl-CoA transferase